MTPPVPATGHDIADHIRNGGKPDAVFLLYDTYKKTPESKNCGTIAYADLFISPEDRAYLHKQATLALAEQVNTFLKENIATPTTRTNYHRGYKAFIADKATYFGINEKEIFTAIARVNPSLDTESAQKQLFSLLEKEADVLTKQFSKIGLTAPEKLDAYTAMHDAYTVLLRSEITDSAKKAALQDKLEKAGNSMLKTAGNYFAKHQAMFSLDGTERKLPDKNEVFDMALILHKTAAYFGESSALVTLTSRKMASNPRFMRPLLGDLQEAFTTNEPLMQMANPLCREIFFLLNPELPKNIYESDLKKIIDSKLQEAIRLTSPRLS